MAETMISSFDGTKLYLNRETEAGNRAIAVIVHGLCEHQGRYDYMAKCLHESGIGTYRFDHRGHGRSEGEDTYYGDFNEMLDDVNVVVDMAIANHPDLPVFLIGHSMGGFAVSLYGVKYPDKRLRGIVTSGGKDPNNRKTFTFGLCYAIVEGLNWFSPKKQDFKYPVLMLHGEKDGLVSVRDTYEFFASASSADRQMKIYGNLFHEIFNEYCRDEVIGNVIGWIINRI